MATIFQLPCAAPVFAGESLPGAKLYFFQAGTTTPITTYTTSALSVARDHPVVADSDGVFGEIWINEAVNSTYRVQLKTSADVLKYDKDNQTTGIGNDFGSYTGTFTGCTTSNTVVVRYARVGKLVTLNVDGDVATSNATSFTITGAPASIRPSFDVVGYQTVYAFTNNGTVETGETGVRMNTSGVLVFARSNSTTGFTNSGNKGPNDFTYTYLMAETV